MYLETVIFCTRLHPKGPTCPSRFCRSSTWGGPCLGLEFPEAHRASLSHKSIVYISHFDTLFFLSGLLREAFSRFIAKMVNITEKIKE